MLSAALNLDLFATAAVRPVEAPGSLNLRPYQQGAREAVEATHRRSRGALVVLPVGTGKTRLAGAVCWDAKLRGAKVLVTAPTIVLCHQMYDSLRALGLSCSIEQADNHVRWPLPDVTVASVATMRGARLRQFPPTTFGLVIADEAHRSVSASQMAIFEHFASAKRLGLTATPDRVDGVSLANVFDELAYEMSMLQAIQDGWLVRLKFKTAITDFDAKRLRTIGGEVSAGSVEAEIMRCGLLHEAASTLAELSSGERTVAFLPTVAASKAFVGELLARGVTAAHVDGGTSGDVRNLAFERFKRGDVRVLSNVGICVEGWDMPEASVIALLNPTKSRSRITQMIGRCTRLAPGKTHALVLDFCPGRMKKGRLASPADALAGKMLDDETIKHIAKQGDLAKAISDAEHTVEEIAEKKRRASEVAKRKAERVAELAALAKSKPFTYGVQDHDANAVLGGQGSAATTYVSGGVEVDEETWRKQRGLCTPRQGAKLAERGLNPWLSRRLANEALDAIAANRWKVPEHIRADERFYRKRDLAADKAAADAALLALKGG